jgi:EmrB/QacA subfamily drug resistance transporter
MSGVFKHPSDEHVIHSKKAAASAVQTAGTWVLVATILGSSMSFIDGTVVNVALPTIQRELNATAADVQWVIQSYALFLAALILVGGALGDRLGRRRVFSAGIVLFTAASVVCGLAPNILILILARAVQGVGGALLVPGSLAIISASFAAERRGRAIGTWSAFTTITTALGPVLGGWLVQSASWRWVFFINVPLAAITLAVTFRAVPETRDPDATGPLDWLGATLATLGLGGLTFGLIQASAEGFGAPQVWLALLVGVAALVAFVLVEQRAAEPMMPLVLFRSKTFSGANLLTLLLYGALGGALYFLPFNLQQVQGYSPAAAGAAFLPFTVIVFSLSRWAGGLVPRYGPKRPLIIGPIIVALGFVLFTLPGVGGSYWLTFFPAVVVMSLGMALVIAPLTTAVMGAVPSTHSGTASGINNAVSRCAGLIAIAVLNIIVVLVFSAHYDGGIAALHLPSTAQAALAAQRTRLAGVQIPAGLTATQSSAVRGAIDTSFVAGFRVAMLVAAALAAASSVAAGVLIEGPGLGLRKVLASRPGTQPSPGAPATETPRA